MATEHIGATTSQDAAILVDIDLATLGALEHVYAEFEEHLRFEYKKVPGMVFGRGRRKILGEFLERDKINSHDMFYSQLEERARTNLKWAIAQLS